MVNFRGREHDGWARENVNESKIATHETCKATFLFCCKHKRTWAAVILKTFNRNRGDRQAAWTLQHVSSRTRGSYARSTWYPSLAGCTRTCHIQAMPDRLQVSSRNGTVLSVRDVPVDLVEGWSSSLAFSWQWTTRLHYALLVYSNNFISKPA